MTPDAQLADDLRALQAAGRKPTGNRRNDYRDASAAFLHHHDCESRPVQGYPGIVACCCGRIWSSGKTKGHAFRELKRTPGRREYLVVQLNIGGRKLKRHVHRLVLLAFVGSADGMECRHLNGDPTDNRADNLVWGTPRENAADRDRHGRTVIGTRSIHVGTVLDDAAVRAAVARVEEGESIRSVARSLGLSMSTVWRWVRGLQRRAAVMEGS